MCNPNSRKSGSLQPLASAKRKRAESPLQSALRAAVNRGGAALQPRLLLLQPNRRLIQPIWGCSSLCADFCQNRPNFAFTLSVVYFLRPAVKAGIRGDRLAYRRFLSFSTVLPSNRLKQLSVYDSPRSVMRRSRILIISASFKLTGSERPS